MLSLRPLLKGPQQGIAFFRTILSTPNNKTLSSYNPLSTGLTIRHHLISSHYRFELGSSMECKILSNADGFSSDQEIPEFIEI
jgi:hypothetical protein